MASSEKCSNFVSYKQKRLIQLEKDIIIDGQKLHYEESGDGKPLILMHGWGCNLATVRSIAATASLNRKVYNIDMPGFGQSPEPSTVWGVGDYADIIEKFITRMNIGRPILAGHSFGGRVAIMLASRGVGLDSLILIDSAGVKPHRKLSYYFKIYSFKASKAMMKLFMSKDAYEKRLEKIRKSRGSADYANSSPAMRAIMSKVVNEDLTPLLPSIKIPTLLIWGENDSATPIADAKKMERLIPDAGLVSFPNCGHYSFLDNPGQFKAVLLSFLSTR